MTQNRTKRKPGLRDRSQGSPADEEHAKRVSLFGVQIDRLTMSEVVEIVNGWIGERGGKCRYVVTPNVDHTVMLRESEQLRRVYRDADLVIADGWPVVAASRIVGKPLPERVPGSDLVPALFSAASAAEPISVYLFGAGASVAQRAAQVIHRRWSGVRVVGMYSPPLGFEYDESHNRSILDKIAAADPDVLVVGLGAPKQEYWVHKHQAAIHAKVALCVGAAIDFLSGDKPRAPAWVQRIGMEWFHRLIHEPGRLAERYLRDACVFPGLVWQEWWKQAEGA